MTTSIFFGQRLKRSFFVILILLVFLIGSVGSNVSAEEKEVKVGLILPFSGFLAAYGEPMKGGAELAVDSINNAGGIKSMGGAKIKIISGDTQSKPDVGIAETERLIQREKVSVLVGALQSGVSFTTSAVAEKYKVPYMVATSVKNEITKREGFKYVFRHTGDTSQNVNGMVNSFLDLAKETGYKAKTAAIVGENTDFGQDAEKILKGLLPQKGFEILMVDSWPFNISDLTPTIIKLKKANPDVVFITGYAADSVLFVKTAAAMKFKAPLVSSGGDNSPLFLQSVGNHADGNFTRTTTSIELIKKFPEVRQIFEAYKKESKHDLTDEAANVYTLFWVLKNALERAGSSDPKKIRDALAATDIPEGQPWMVEMNPRVTFGKNGQNPRAPFLLVQYQNRVRHVVWPKKYRTAEPKLPK